MNSGSGSSGGGAGGSERSARNEVRLEDVAEQLDAIEGKVDEVVERSIQNEQDVRWLKWGVRGVAMAAVSALVTGLVNLVGG